MVGTVSLAEGRRTGALAEVLVGLVALLAEGMVNTLEEGTTTVAAAEVEVVLLAEGMVNTSEEGRTMAESAEGEVVLLAGGRMLTGALSVDEGTTMLVASPEG